MDGHLEICSNRRPSLRDRYSRAISTRAAIGRSRQCQRARHGPVWRRRDGRAGHCPSDADEPDDDHDHRSGRTLSAPVPSCRSVRNHRASVRVSGRRASSGRAGRRCVRTACDPERQRHRRECHGDRRRHRPRGRPEPDCGNRLGGRGPQSADERTEFSGTGAARTWRVADQRRQHTTLSRDVGGPRRHAVGGEPAESFEQLHCRRPLGQR